MLKKTTRALIQAFRSLNNQRKAAGHHGNKGTKARYQADVSMRSTKKIMGSKWMAKRARQEAVDTRRSRGMK